MERTVDATQGIRGNVQLMLHKESAERTVDVGGDLVLAEEAQSVLRSRPLPVLQQVLKVLCVQSD